MGENDEFIREFLVEAAENLDQLDRDLVALEQNPRDGDRLASIFRTVHTIKGTSGFFGFSKLGAITHGGEHLLGQLRDDKIDLDDHVSGVLLELVDAVRTILDRIEKTGGEGDDDFNPLSQSLARISEEALDRRRSGGVVVTRLTPPALPPAAPPAPEPAPEPAEAIPAAAVPAPVPIPEPPVAVAIPEPAVAVAMPEPPVAVPIPEPAVAPAPAPVAATPAVVVPPEPVPPEAVPAPQLAASPPPAAAPAAPAAAAGRKPAVAEQSIRVDVGLLGSLVDLVGELVLARNQLEATVRAADGTRQEDAELLKVVHRVDTVTAALQAAAMKTRMQPIDQVFSKFPRIVRDLAVTCGKEVALSIDGADTELDRSLIETIRDPLTHLVRNAVDHGIEPPAARLAKGKPRAGRLALRAYHESGQVMVEIEDDGGGIAVDVVRAKAVARGLVTAEEAAALPDERVFQFIFEPGFSTAAKVTDVSGRGVGMDVVRTNIEAVGGSVDLSSRPGLGTTIRVRIPLTLAIIPALIVSCGGHRFAIPQVAVRELIALRAGATSSPVAVEGLDGAPVIRLRGRLLPLVFLGSLLGIGGAAQAGGEGRGTVVVLRGDDHEFGLVVDGVTVAEDIVVKPIVAALVALGLYAGATVRGDGAVVLILDPRGIAHAARIPPRGAGDEAAEAEAAPAAAERYLVCESPAGRAVAVPLDDVSRLETFPRERLQRAAGHTVVHREGRLTAIADLDAALTGVPGPLDAPAVTAVILAPVHGEVGLRVRRILEVVLPEVPIDRALRAPAVLGTIAVAGRATEVIDVRQLVPAGSGPAPQVPA